MNVDPNLYRQRLEELIEMLIEALDGIDDDPDLEPEVDCCVFEEDMGTRPMRYAPVVPCYLGGAIPHRQPDAARPGSRAREVSPTSRSLAS